jgi:hypothetical protein
MEATYHKTQVRVRTPAHEAVSWDRGLGEREHRDMLGLNLALSSSVLAMMLIPSESQSGVQ